MVFQTINVNIYCAMSDMSNTNRPTRVCENIFNYKILPIYKHGSKTSRSVMDTFKILIYIRDVNMPSRAGPCSLWGGSLGKVPTKSQTTSLFFFFFNWKNKKSKIWNSTAWIRHDSTWHFMSCTYGFKNQPIGWKSHLKALAELREPNS